MSKLAYVAREMRAAVIRADQGSGGTCTRELQRGLRLRLALIVDPLERSWQTWALTLSRPAVAPSVQEIAIVRGAFGVPAEAEFIQVTPFEVQLRWPI